MLLSAHQNPGFFRAAESLLKDTYKKREGFDKDKWYEEWNLLEAREKIVRHVKALVDEDAQEHNVTPPLPEEILGASLRKWMVEHYMELKISGQETEESRRMFKMLNDGSTLTNILKIQEAVHLATSYASVR